MRISILFATACMFVLSAGSGCKKPEQEVQIPPTLTAKEKLLTEGAWIKLKDETTLPFAPGRHDWFLTELSYLKDDKSIFKTNKEYELNSAELVRPGQSPNTVVARLTWSLTDNESKLVLQGRPPAIIETLTTSSLVLFYPDTTTGQGYDRWVTYGR